MKVRTSGSLRRQVLLLLLLVGISKPGLIGQVQTVGSWSTQSYTTPLNPIHVALLYNGKILIVAGSGNCPSSLSGCPSGPPYGPTNQSGAALLDPATGTFTQFTTNWDMFCNGMVLLPDGRALIDGGTLQYDPFFGQPKASIFDPATNSFTDTPNMAHGRWYPTLTALGDGRIMAFSGSDENGNTNTQVEFYTVSSGWSQASTAPFTPDLYPRMHLLPNGKVFASGAQPTSYLFDPSGPSWTPNVATTNYGATRIYGSSVLLPLTPANNYDAKVMIMGGNSPATATTEIIDLGASTPQWVYGPNMSQARIEMNAVVLPSGKVLALGGSVTDEDSSTESLNADLYDPASNTFSSAGANAYARLYHSVALLLPDATVWLAGGNPSRGNYEPHIEIYQPAYLFQSNGTLATRPSITTAPGSINYGNQFTVQTPDAANISSVVLVRAGTVTHSFGMDQRLVGVSFTAGSGSLTVTAPPSGNIAPPGYYMLFILNSAGVPAVASFVLLNSSSSAPTITSLSPNSGPDSGGTGVTITGTNFLAGATVSFGGTAATGVTVVSGTSITATTPANAVGVVTVAVTNPDSQSGALANGYTYTSTNPAPTVTSITPNTGPPGGGTGVTISGANFLAGAAVTFGGTAATGVTVVNSTSITANTPVHTAEGGVVSVVATNPDGQSGTLANGYTYVSSNPSLGLGVASGFSGSATVAAGQTASYTLSIGGAGMSATASLSCTGAPMGANCSVPVNEPFSATVPASFNVTVTTTSRTLGALHPPVSMPVWLWATAALGLVVGTGICAPKRFQRRYLWLAPLTLLLFLGSCGGGGMPGGPQPNPNGTPAGTYTLTVKATSGSSTAVTSLMLTVQ
jgi:hypothetical protein